MTDWRDPQLARKAFDHFYQFQLQMRSHPGGVYYVLPYMAKALGWDEEQQLWAAFLNGCTQHPPTTLLLMAAGDRMEHASNCVDFWAESYLKLEFDTDRRHHKSAFRRSVEGYLALVGDNQRAYWLRAAEGGWSGVWTAALAIPTFGRLSAWSYLEYVHLLTGLVPDAETFLFEDADGSRSHRNGMCLITDRRQFIQDVKLNSSPEPWPEDLPAQLEVEAHAIVKATPGGSAFTLESALCTFKSFHKPLRRYPNCYNDMLFDRLKKAESRWGQRFAVIWEARERSLPPDLLMEKNPLEPGCVPVKQNWYLTKGELVHMGREWPDLFPTSYHEHVAAGAFRFMRRYP